jgi:hypothetical protein
MVFRMSYTANSASETGSFPVWLDGPKLGCG